MSLKKYMKNKKGSYIVEAAILFPIFIISLLSLISIITIMASCEKVVFTTCQSARLTSQLSSSYSGNIYYPLELNGRLKKENPIAKNVRVLKCNYRYRDNDIDELIDYSIMADYPKIKFELPVRFRAFIGKMTEETPMSRSQMETSEAYRKVFIFPDYGERFHREGCYYLKNADKNKKDNETRYIEVDREIAIKRGYTPCQICGGS